MTLGENIRAFRKKRKLTQAALGAMLEPSVTQQQIAQYETGVNTPKIETLQRIADALEIPIEKLLPDGRYTAAMDFFNPTFEWIEQHLPTGYKLRSENDINKLWIEYPNGDHSIDINVGDLQEIINKTLEYLKFELEPLRANVRIKV